jgi:NADPH-dependent ferric siderophore reductase
MNAIQQFKLSGVARPHDAVHMLDEICEHFVEHADVERNGHNALLKSKLGTASIRIQDSSLLIDLSCPTETALQMSRNSIAEHLFYFAGDEPLELDWSKSTTLSAMPNIHQLTVLSAEDVTPHMRRVRFSCDSVDAFVGGDMHVRLLVPPRGRTPVWPGYREDGRVAWPEGEDELLVRIYTIRGVDAERKELWIDFLQHPMPGVKTPGADFARDAQPGQIVAFLGPGGGGVPKAQSLLMAGDESALPAIARIVAELPATTAVEAIIEVADQSEEQQLASKASMKVHWLHRTTYPAGRERTLLSETQAAIASREDDTFVWFACEKEDVREMRTFLKGRGHDRKKMYVAWYWERDED